MLRRRQVKLETIGSRVKGPEQSTSRYAGLINIALGSAADTLDIAVAITGPDQAIRVIQKAAG